MEEQIRKFSSIVENQEATVKELQNELESLVKTFNTNQQLDDSVIPEEVQKLRLLNTKYQCRINVLKRSIGRLEQSNGGMTDDFMPSVQEVLSGIFLEAVKRAYPQFHDPISTILPSQSESFGDYKFINAMQMFKVFKDAGQKTSPQEVAAKIIANIPPNDVINTTEVAGPGFINITLKREYVRQQLIDLLKKGVRPPNVGRKLRVVIDFSSPNIAKQMHVGHLRSTVIGESISRLLEYVGHDVLRINHIGDWGTQFGMLIAHLQEKFPDYLSVSPPLSDLQAFYKESKVRFESDAEFKKRAYDCVVQLQSYEPNIIKAWKLICEASMKELDVIYDRLQVTNNYRGESYYQKMMDDVVKELDAKGVLEQDEGRKIMFGPGCSVPLTIVKSDGGYTYDTSDMAAIRNRLFDENGEWLIYVVDSGQASHFQILFACAQRMGWYDPSKIRVEHVSFGVVLGEDRKKFKTRSGDTVQLAELLDEGLKRSLKKLQEKGRDKILTPEELKAAQEGVAYGCIKYADLSQNRTKDYVFSFDKMLDDRGNTAAYLLYTYIRIRSIARNANVSADVLKQSVSETEINLDHPKELRLAKCLLRFPDVILRLLNELYINGLCDFLFELSSIFTEFYDNCYCVQKDKQTGEVKHIHIGRLLLCEATAIVMASCFHILGISTIEKM